MVAGIAALSVGMLPLRFFDGHAVLGWSRAAWLTLTTLGSFGFVHILLRPGGPGGGVSGRLWPLLVFLFAYTAVAVGFWGTFRRRALRRELTSLAEPKLKRPDDGRPRYDVSAVHEVTRPRPSPHRRRGPP